jgi:hypothetical protein
MVERKAKKASEDKIVRRPVQKSDVIAGMKRPKATTGRVNHVRQAQARQVERTGGVSARVAAAANAKTAAEKGNQNVALTTMLGPRSLMASTMGIRTAGMMLDGAGMNLGTYGSSSSSAYNTSYASGNIQYGGGIRDVPAYFMTMNENNGGLIYWPVSLREKYEWYRYFARTDSYVGRALELLTDLPMSKLTLNMPKMEGKSKRLKQDIYDFYSDMCERLGLFEKLQQALWEYNLIGNCFPASHRVHMLDGMLSIAEVRKGDLVRTHTGQYRPVEAISRRWVDEELVVLDVARLQYGEFTSTEEHPIFVLDGQSEKYIAAKDVRVGDYVSVGVDMGVCDKGIFDIAAEFVDGQILSRYDTSNVSVLNERLHVDVSYTTRSGVSEKTNNIKVWLMDWMKSLTEPIVATCQQIAEKLGLNDVSKLRSVAYSLRQRGVIRAERSGFGRLRGGSAIKWYPLDGEASLSDVYGRTFTKRFETPLLQLPITDDFMYLLGYWLGDGCLWKYKNQSHTHGVWDVCFANDSPCVERVIEACDSVFGECVGEVSSGVIGDGLSHLVINDPLLCMWWNRHFGASCLDKKLPGWVMSLPPEKQIWLLRGLIDSDGCISGKTVNITATNESLMQQVFQVGLRCGVPFSFTQQERTAKLPSGCTTVSRVFCLAVADGRFVGGLVEGCVKELDCVVDDVGCVNPNWKQIGNRFYFRVNGVGRKHYSGYVYNLQVADDHTYCVENINTHNCFMFHEWDDKAKSWSKIVILPPEEVVIFQYPFTDNARVEYRPEKLIDLIKKSLEGFAGENELEKQIVANVPKDLKKMVKKEGCIVMDTDPMTGSFVYHLARRRSPYLDLGSSVLERILVPMLMKEHYRYTQLGLASRNMTPKNLISAEGLSPDELDDLREQVDLSYMDPDYSIVTNYNVTWEQIGADQRLLDLTQEYETIENQVFAGLGVTRELLTGEGSFSGNKITIEILNTMFLLTRQVLQRYVERMLFLPIAEAHGWYEETRNGIKKYFYPKLGFNRLTIRDNQEVFDSLFQLYQKGSLPIDIIYELFNLNVEDIHEKIYDDLFTVKDPNFNRVVEEISSEVGRAVVEETNVKAKVAEYLGLDVTGGEGEDEDEGFGGGFGGFGGFGGDEEAPAEEEPAMEDVEETPDEGEQPVEEEVPEDAGSLAIAASEEDDAENT